MIYTKLHALSQKQMITFDSCMIQRNIEDAMEFQNPIVSY